jgi:hypothetical protein
VDKVFNLKTLNEQVHGLDYEYYDSKDKPSEISSSVIQGDAKISWNDLDPQDDIKWNCFLKLRKITEILTAPLVSAELAAYLQIQ